MFKISALILFLFAPIAHADQVKYLARGPEALAAFLAQAASARKSIDLATFIFEPCDTSTRMLLDTFARKARSGVRVRVLLDDIMQSRAQKQILADFAHRHGFEFRFYNTVEKNIRLHIKLMAVDGESYITGGRNISDKYFSLSAEKNYVDRDLLVRGTSGRQAAAAFEELWASKNSSPKVGEGARFEGGQRLCPIDDSVRRESVRQFLDRNPDILARVPTRSCASVKFVADSPDFGHAKYGGGSSAPGSGEDPYMNPGRLERKRATKQMLEFIRGASASLRMENWVYMPIYGLADVLAEARERKVRIRGITNADTEDGPQVFREAMDYAVATYTRRHSVGSQKVRRISSFGGVSDAFELTPRGTKFYLHGKVYLRDERDLVVSSFNLDSRSYNTNLESLVVVKNCPHLVADAEAGLQELIATYDEDVKSGRVPPKKPASLLAKAFAMVALVFF